VQVSEVVSFVGRTRDHYWLLQELYAFTTRLIGTIYIVIVVVVAYQFTRLRLPRSLRVSPILWLSIPTSFTGIVSAESPLSTSPLKVIIIGRCEPSLEL